MRRVHGGVRLRRRDVTFAAVWGSGRIGYYRMSWITGRCCHGWDVEVFNAVYFQCTFCVLYLIDAGKNKKPLSSSH